MLVDGGPAYAKALAYRDDWFVLPTNKLNAEWGQRSPEISHVSKLLDVMNNSLRLPKKSHQSWENGYLGKLLSVNPS